MMEYSYETKVEVGKLWTEVAFTEKCSQQFVEDSTEEHREQLRPKFGFKEAFFWGEASSCVFSRRWLQNSGNG